MAECCLLRAESCLLTPRVLKEPTDMVTAGGAPIAEMILVAFFSNLRREALRQACPAIKAAELFGEELDR